MKYVTCHRLSGLSLSNLSLRSRGGPLHALRYGPTQVTCLATLATCRACACAVPMKSAAKRVYKHVGVRALAATKGQAGAFCVTLDDRELRTPARQVLRLPTQELALGVAYEWEAQKKFIFQL